MRRGTRAEEAFAGRAAGLDRRQRHFLMELAYGVIRWKARLDWHLDSLLPRGLGALPDDVVAILELGAYQLLFMTRVPAWSAVDESVSLVRVETPPGVARWASGLVNGVLRNLDRARDDLALPDPADEAGWLAVRWSHPRWMVERWLARFGRPATETLLAKDNTPPPLHLHPNALRATAEEVLERLRTAGIAARRHDLAPDAIVVEDSAMPDELPGWEEGWFWVQDAGAQWVVRAAPPPARVEDDACAAPGGKLAAAVAGARPRCALAVEIDPARLALVARSAARLGLEGLRLVVADARALPTRAAFDWALLDVPCSGTGVLGRRVDARWRRRPDDPARFATLQRDLLAAVAGHVKPGGTLIYATCSLEQEENEGVVEPFLAERSEFCLASVEDVVPVALREGPYLFTRPWRADVDGLFAARLVRAT